MRTQGNPRILSHSSKLVLQVYRSVACREAAISRLQHLERNVTTNESNVDEIQKNLLSLRHATLDCVEAIATWRGESNAVWVDPQTSGNFLDKIKSDTEWLAKSEIAQFFLFSDKPDPFLVLPSSLKAKNGHRQLQLSKDDVDRIRRAEKILANEKVIPKSLRPVSGHPLDKKFAISSDRRVSEPALTVTKISKHPDHPVRPAPVIQPISMIGHVPPLALSSPTRVQELATSIVACLPGSIPEEALTESESPTSPPATLESFEQTGQLAAEASRRGSDALPTLVPQESGAVYGQDSTGDFHFAEVSMPAELADVLDFTRSLGVHEGEVGMLVEQKLRWLWLIAGLEISEISDRQGLLAYRHSGDRAEILFLQCQLHAESEIGQRLLHEFAELQTVATLTCGVLTKVGASDEKKRTSDRAGNFRVHVADVLMLSSREGTSGGKSSVFGRANIGAPVLLAQGVRRLGAGRMYQHMSGNFLEKANADILALRDRLRDAMVDLPEISCALVAPDFEFPWKSEHASVSFAGARALLVAELTLDLRLDLRGMPHDQSVIALPLQAVGQFDKDHPKVFFMETSQPDIFMFAFSAETWETDEDSFAKVSKLLQDSEIRKSRKFDFLALPFFSKEYVDASLAFDGLPFGTDRVGKRLVERLDVRLCADHDTQALTDLELERTFRLKEPFICGLWHSGLDKLDIPLLFFRVLPDPRRLYANSRGGSSLRRSISGINVAEGCVVVPVDADISKFESQFQGYAKRCKDQGWSPEDQWLSLHRDAAVLHRGTVAPRWHWICKKSGDRVGLLVYRVLAAKKTVHVLHLSVIRNEFLSVAVKFTKQHIFASNGSAKFIRVSLPHDRSSLVLDIAVDGAYKDSGFRWFQMTQTEEGERVTVMSVTRNTLEDGDLQEISDPPSIFLRQANILGLSPGLVEGQKRPTSLAIGNRIVLAQALRALGVVDGPRSGTPGGFVCELLANMEKVQTFVKCVDAEKAASIVDARTKASELLEYPDLTLDRWAISETSDPSEQLVGCMRVDTEMPNVFPAHPMEALREYEVNVVRVSSVSVSSEGRAVYFVSTDNSELMIFVASAGDVSGGVDLFREVDRWLKTSKQQVPAVEFVMIPSFNVESLRHSEAFAGIKTLDGSLSTGRLSELTKLAVRGSAAVPGILKTQVDIHNTEVLTEDFVFGFWHASLDDIDVPLFALLVDTSAWIKRAPLN